MLRRLPALMLALFLALALSASSLAQQYLFGVPKETVDVSWNADGTESIDYTFAFNNQAGAHAIDIVDVGMPNGNFDMSTASADVNGTSVNVSQGDYQGNGSGFSVVLGSLAIPPGSSGTVHARMGRVTGVLYPDTSDSNYASADFGPTYFGSQYVTGSTDLTVTFHLPPGVQPAEPRYHPAQNWPGPSEPQAALDDAGRVTYTWSAPNASAAAQYTFGASFPKSYVPADAIVTAPAFDFGGLFTFIFANLGTCLCIGFFGFLFIGMPILGVIQGQRRKLQYLPPKISIEGHGIKRGLTAVEAGILLEEPLDKVLTMILFGVVKKGAATVTSRDPLTIQVASPAPDGLHDYELSFLNAFKSATPADRQKQLSDLTVALVRSVSEKMKGFSRKETQDYYKNIMEQAWAQVAAAQTPEVKGQKIDENLEWTMLDRDYEERSRRVFTGPVFFPMWWGNYDPTYSPTAGGGHMAAPVPAAVGGHGSSALPGADLAASMVGGVQNFSKQAVGNLNTFTSRISNVTNPPPPPSQTSYRGGGGGGCACACACAGCACACAGGGR
jgi:hypothetical protein